MARHKEFDPNQATLAAMRVFWQKGYDGTSIPDLLAATGLSRSSLYETFGDKAGLFQACTQAYAEVHGAQRYQALRQARSAREGLTQFFKLQVDACLHTDNPRGCLLTNTATSLDSHDPHIAQLVADSTEGLRQEFQALLVRGQAGGELQPGLDVQAASRLLLGVSFGMNVMAKVSPDRQSLESMAASAIAAVLK